MTARQAALKFPAALRRWFDWHADEADGRPPEMDEIRPIATLLAEASRILGPDQSRKVYDETAASWTRETGRCDVCGGPAHA